jgi:hypothetical protein
VLQRSGTRRPYFRRWDWLFWVVFSRWWPHWRDSLIIVQPETVLRWRREGCLRFGDIDPGVAGATDARGFPGKSAI